MNIIFICTSNKDRSPSLERHFREHHPQHKYRSAGINKYHTTKKGTHYLTGADLQWADLVVFAEEVHLIVTQAVFKNDFASDQAFVILGLGEYKQGEIDQEYIKGAEEKLKQFIQ